VGLGDGFGDVDELCPLCCEWLRSSSNACCSSIPWTAKGCLWRVRWWRGDSLWFEVAVYLLSALAMLLLPKQAIATQGEARSNRPQRGR
jgi:hypothetical protein